MSFNGQDTNQQIDTSMNSMLLLHSSCQGLIEASIEKADSSWYDALDQALGQAEDLVIAWRTNGYLYFSQDILEETLSYGTTFTAFKEQVDALFAKFQQNPDPTIKKELVDCVSALVSPLSGMKTQIDGYLTKLQKFESDMQVPHDNMNQTIAEVQAQESQIESDIASINAQIKQLQAQVETDRKAIAKAKRVRKEGIVETIFGVLLAPVTGGLSLILAGIGVASIAEAEGKIDTMKSQISDSQKNIVADQGNLSEDQQMVATLNGLSMSSQVAINDCSLISDALDSLRLNWDLFGGELSGAIDDLNRATTADEAFMVKAWFDAACDEWGVIVDHVNDLMGRSVSTTRVTVG